LQRRAVGHRRGERRAGEGARPGARAGRSPGDPGPRLPQHRRRPAGAGEPAGAGAAPPARGGADGGRPCAGRERGRLSRRTSLGAGLRGGAAPRRLPGGRPRRPAAAGMRLSDHRRPGRRGPGARRAPGADDAGQAGAGGPLAVPGAGGLARLARPSRGRRPHQPQDPPAPGHRGAGGGGPGGERRRLRAGAGERGAGGGPPALRRAVARRHPCRRSGERRHDPAQGPGGGGGGPGAQGAGRAGPRRRPGGRDAGLPGALLVRELGSRRLRPGGLLRRQRLPRRLRSARLGGAGRPRPGDRLGHLERDRRRGRERAAAGPRGSAAGEPQARHVDPRGAGGVRPGAAQRPAAGDGLDARSRGRAGAAAFRRGCRGSRPEPRGLPRPADAGHRLRRSRDRGRAGGGRRLGAVPRHPGDRRARQLLRAGRAFADGHPDHLAAARHLPGRPAARPLLRGADDRRAGRGPRRPARRAGGRRGRRADGPPAGRGGGALRSGARRPPRRRGEPAMSDLTPTPARPRTMGDFLVIWFGQVISTLGSGLTAFALGVWAFRQTGSVTALSLITLFATLPNLLLSPLAGALTDRWSRRTVLLINNFGSGTCTLLLALLYWSGRIEIWHIYVLVLASRCFNVFQLPAFAAATVQLVPRRHLVRANGLAQMGPAAALIAAPMLAATLMDLIGVGGVIFLDFSSFLFAAATLLSVEIPKPQASAAGQEGRGSLLYESLYGWTYIRKRPGLLGLLLFFAAANYFLAVVQILLTPLVLSFASTRTLGVV